MSTNQDDFSQEPEYDWIGNVVVEIRDILKEINSKTLGRYSESQEVSHENSNFK